MADMAKALPGNRPAPGGSLGSRSARQGPPGTRPRNHAVCVFDTAHGRLRAGWAGAGAGGKGAPHATPRPARRVGGGLVGGGRARRPPGGGAPWRRPLASGRMASKGRGRTTDPATAHAVQERGARAGWCHGMQHRGIAVEAIAMATEAAARVLGRATTGGEPCAGQAARTVRNGGDAETCRNVTRLVPTQLQQQLSASVWLRLRTGVE